MLVFTKLLIGVVLTALGFVLLVPTALAVGPDPWARRRRERPSPRASVERPVKAYKTSP